MDTMEEKIIEKFLRGVSPENIAKQLNVSLKTVCMYIQWYADSCYGNLPQ